MGLYFAYGSNLSLEAMAQRCPRAIPLCPFTLDDSRLVFRGVADCIFEPGSKCPGAIWRITPECEARLDTYEGVKGGLYRKEYIPICDDPDGETQMLVYAMNSTGIYPPGKGYLQIIADGYRDFGLPMKALKQAVRESWDRKAPTHAERHRHFRKGCPELAVGVPKLIRARVRH